MFLLKTQTIKQFQH